MNTVSDAIKYLMRKEQYYGIFALMLNKRFDDKVPTAGVRLCGINFELVINKEWWYGLKPEQRVGLLKHELLHICFDHPFTSKNYADRRLCNMAEDFEINSYIDRSMLPEQGCFVEEKGWEPHKGTKHYYALLEAEQKQKKKNQKDNQKGGQGNDQGDQSDSDNGDGNEPPQYDDHSGFYEEVSKLSKEQQELVKNQVEYQIKAAAEQTQKSRGTIPGELQSLIDELFKVKPPVVNWKGKFRRLLGVNFDIHQKKTRRKESNRFEDCPGLRKRKKHKILVAIDTSGSVSDAELMDFWSEINHIYKASAEIHVLEADMRITNEYDYNGKTPKKVTGRGGTSFTECVDYYNTHRKDYTLMVYFTDGYGDQTECKPIGRMVWIITSQGISRDYDNQFPGDVVHIPSIQN